MVHVCVGCSGAVIEQDGDDAVTELGVVFSRLPVDISVARLLVIGAVNRCSVGCC